VELVAWKVPEFVKYGEETVSVVAEVLIGPELLMEAENVVEAEMVVVMLDPKVSALAGGPEMRPLMPEKEIVPEPVIDCEAAIERMPAEAVELKGRIAEASVRLLTRESDEAMEIWPASVRLSKVPACTSRVVPSEVVRVPPFKVPERMKEPV